MSTARLSRLLSNVDLEGRASVVIGRRPAITKISVPRGPMPRRWSVPWTFFSCSKRRIAGLSKVRRVGCPA
jgi:hypothetical protein